MADKAKRGFASMTSERRRQLPLWVVKLARVVADLQEKKKLMSKDRGRKETKKPKKAKS